jgi:uncharacterized membrane protein
MWFAGAVMLGARPRSTVWHTIALVASGVLGATLIGLGLFVPWNGVALGLGMEFGVGLIAVPIIDIVIVRFFYRTLSDVAAGRAVVAWPRR